MHDTGASRFLYPFLDEGERDLLAVLADVSRSVKMKAEEVGALRQRTLTEAPKSWTPPARCESASTRGGTLLAFGNGGSATDAMDLVADFRAAPQGWPARRALDLTALGEARRQGLATIAFVGYDGGRIAAERLADSVIVTTSQYVPRIQEAQASAYHALRELVRPGRGLLQDSPESPGCNKNFESREAAAQPPQHLS